MMFDELIAEERKEGILLGKEEQMRMLIEKKLAKGLSIAQIAEHLEEEEETIRKYVEKLKEVSAK